MTSQFRYYHDDIDKHPFTGDRETDFLAKISEKRWLNGYFNGHPGWEQVTNVTRGKTYRITAVTGYGDMCSYHFIGDDESPMTLGDMFFVDPDSDESDDTSVDRSLSVPREKQPVPDPA